MNIPCQPEVKDMAAGLIFNDFARTSEHSEFPFTKFLAKVL
jgi:hypothetical protein